MIKPHFLLIFIVISLVFTACNRDGRKVHKDEPFKQRPMAGLASHSLVKEMGAMPAPAVERDRYHKIDSNPVVSVKQQPVSTFSVDVDTGAYSNVRRYLNDGRLPPHDAVRSEEMINYFGYDYPAPEAGEPFSVSTEVATTPWNANTLLLRIGVRAKNPSAIRRPAANLVFLLDVSGSMHGADRLGLLKKSLKIMAQQLNPRDRVAIVVYAGASGLVLESTPGDQSGTIIAAMDELEAGGPTKGSAGIELAYATARSNFIKGGINRVILGTDGDFNVGLVDENALVDYVSDQRKSGIALSVLGFGRGNLNDAMMEQLADAGNGNYAYIDSLSEANKVMGRQIGGTLYIVAQDVKVQVEFNPAQVAEYRLIGYENRLLRQEDFANDKVDAGDIGAGHRVTALYEIALVGSAGQRLEPLRYQSSQPSKPSLHGELAFVRLRHKKPGEQKSHLQQFPVNKTVITTTAQSSNDLRFAAAVAAFSDLLRGGRYSESFGYDELLTLARNSRGSDPHGERGQFLAVVELAQRLAQQPAVKVE